MIRTTEVAAQPSVIEATSRIPCHADPALREKHLCSSFPQPGAWRLNPRFFPARLQSARDGPHVGTRASTSAGNADILSLDIVYHKNVMLHNNVA